jgi:cell division protease FtsH
VHAAKLRRLLSALHGEDYPADPTPAWDQLRRATLEAELSIPDLDLDRDIGGYGALKKRIREEILDVIAHKESLDDPAAIDRVESLIPRGIIFWGPPGTGKTLFAKAIASALGAAVQVVGGPELKSRWVGESEENLRRLFVQARQSAPSIIVFDEMDSFAAARGTYAGSGVEHSMVNQLLTEMDGFRDNEMVFVVGTTNFVESLDPALLRPGRFEMALHVPYPEASDRRAILEVHDRRLGLRMSDDALEHAVRQSAYPLDEGGSRWSGDHLQALCRTLARRRVRESREGPTEVMDVDEALAASADRPALTPHEERVVATHEAGHAVAALACEHVPAIERISIRGDLAGALGFVSYADPAHRYVVTRNQLLDGICVLFGGREAERLLCEDLSIGSSHDLERATRLARALVERYGMGPESVGVLDFTLDETGRGAVLAEATRATRDEGVRELLESQRRRAEALLAERRAMVVALRDLLVERKVLDAAAVHRAGVDTEDRTHG